MKEQIKKFLNEEQDPKAIEKITSKLDDLLMKNEEIGYIAVQKKPAITVLPDSIVLTNKRIIICQPKNLGLSMNFIDYTWDEIEGTFVKENILGSEFSFSTKTNIEVSIDYIPKIQARKIFTYAKEQLDIFKNGVTPIITSTTGIPEVTIEKTVAEIPAEEEEISIEEETPIVAEETPEQEEVMEEIEMEEVTHYAEIMPNKPAYSAPIIENTTPQIEKKSSELSQDELFAKLQNYKKLLDNGLILQGEYDAFKKEILSYM